MNKINWVSPFIGFFGLLVAIISLVPSFLSLRKDEPLVSYTAKVNQIAVPSGMNFQNVLEILTNNQIPHGKIELQVVNNGEGPAKELKVRIDSKSKITKYSTIPSDTDNPAWVNVGTPTITSTVDSTIAAQSFKSMAVGKILKIEAWFVHKLGPKTEASNFIPSYQLEVYCDGKPAISVNDLSSAPKVTLFSHFKLPLWILGCTFLLAFLIAFLVKLIRDKEFRSTIGDLFVGDTIIGSIAVGTATSLLFDIISNKIKERASSGTENKGE